MKMSPFFKVFINQLTLTPPSPVLNPKHVFTPEPNSNRNLTLALSLALTEPSSKPKCVLFVQVFEEDASHWEDKLNRLRNMFDVWIDVQRRWVYLEGIFYGSADIKHQLPMEYSRFKSIDNEFLGMMKKT